MDEHEGLACGLRLHRRHRTAPDRREPNCRGEPADCRPPCCHLIGSIIKSILLSPPLPVHLSRVFGLA
jgi:hypothetical protein